MTLAEVVYSIFDAVSDLNLSIETVKWLLGLLHRCMPPGHALPESWHVLRGLVRTALPKNDRVSEFSSVVLRSAVYLHVRAPLPAESRPAVDKGTG